MKFYLKQKAAVFESVKFASYKFIQMWFVSSVLLLLQNSSPIPFLSLASCDLCWLVFVPM